MKKTTIKLLMLSLLLTGCLGSKPIDKKEFHYAEKVLVIDKFYKGQVGRVVEEGKSYSDCFRTYMVNNLEMGSVEICGSNLELTK
jgi:hypothetical protein